MAVKRLQAARRRARPIATRPVLVPPPRRLPRPSRRRHQHRPRRQGARRRLWGAPQSTSVTQRTKRGLPYQQGLPRHRTLQRRLRTMRRQRRQSRGIGSSRRAGCGSTRSTSAKLCRGRCSAATRPCGAVLAVCAVPQSGFDCLSVPRLRQDSALQCPVRCRDIAAYLTPPSVPAHLQTHSAHFQIRPGLRALEPSPLP